MLRMFFRAAKGGSNCRGGTAAGVGGSRGVDVEALKAGLDPVLTNVALDSSSRLLSLAEGVCQSYAANVTASVGTIWRVVKVVVTDNSQRVLDFLSKYSKATKIVAAITLIGFLCKIAYEKISEWMDEPRAQAIALGEEITRMLTDTDAMPSYMMCPLTLMPFVDPVVVPAGQTFEREAITQWIEKNGTNPLTRTALDASQLVPNLAMRDAIQAHQSQVPSTVSAGLAAEEVD